MSDRDGPEDRRDAGERRPLNLQQRLRGLPAGERIGIARRGRLEERVALERIYGKAVWEQLIDNPSITIPEVARIARKGTLPLPLVEKIVSNRAWLKAPRVRRALLSNPRLRGGLIDRVLRAMPAHELKLVHRQTAYPAAVRQAARRLVGR